MKTTRRKVIKNIALGASALMVSPKISFSKNLEESKMEKLSLKGNVHHSVCRWTFNYLSLDDLCKTVKDIGFNAIDLIKPQEWPTLQQHGIYCSMCYTNGENNLYKGLNDPANHEKLIGEYLEVIPEMAKYNYKNLICFSGTRHGLDDETGMKNCAEALDKILPTAEKYGVTMVMELLNSKIDHKDYQCDHTAWGAQLCEKINSENFKLLYDIYHMQIDEGDIIRTIRENHQHIAHYHTGGVPGRHEINDTQELYYPAIMRAIVDTGYKGYVAQEFMPTRENKVDSLREAINICDV
jgi:hydroxypyruvate isomerase